MKVIIVLLMEWFVIFLPPRPASCATLGIISAMRSLPIGIALNHLDESWGRLLLTDRKNGESGCWNLGGRRVSYFSKRRTGQRSGFTMFGKSFGLNGRTLFSFELVPSRVFVARSDHSIQFTFPLSSKTYKKIWIICCYLGTCFLFSNRVIISK